MSEDAPADPDISRAARSMIEQHGQRAAWQAEARAAKLTRHGQRDAVAVWRRIAEAIRVIQRSLDRTRASAACVSGRAAAKPRGIMPMSSWSANVGEQQSTGYFGTDAKGYRSTVEIGSLRIDPHPQNGVILRRFARDGADVHSTRHPDESAAKQKALEEFQVALDEWKVVAP
jgi:hypothetical protein